MKSHDNALRPSEHEAVRGHVAFLPLLVLLAGVLLLAAVYHFVIRPPLQSSRNKNTLIERIENTDRIVVYYTHHRPPHKISYVGEEVQELLAAVKDSYTDEKMYDTTVSLYRVDFYDKDKRTATIFTCSGLFIFEGKQHRSRSRSLQRLGTSP